MVCLHDIIIWQLILCLFVIDQLQDETPSQLSNRPNSPTQDDIIITSETLYKLRLKSCSRPNFCVNLARELFTTDERQESNVKGKRGKKKLDAAKMKVIERNAFHIYPLTTGEQRHTSWRYCEKAIDESCRRLNRRDDIQQGP